MDKEALEDGSLRSRYSMSPYSNRNVEPHGVEKYLVTIERKNADKYNEILNNRIAKLIKEEENTKKKIEFSQKRTLAMMNNHERHLKEMEYKDYIRTVKKQEEEELRLRNFMERERRKKNLSDVHGLVYNKRKTAVNEIKRNGTLGDIALHDFRELVEKKRAEKVQIMKFQMEAKKKNRSKSQFHYKSKLREEYERKIEEEKELYLKNLSKRRELEAIETELLQKISESQALHNNFTPQSLSQLYFNNSFTQYTDRS